MADIQQHDVLFLGTDAQMALADAINAGKFLKF